VNATLEGYNDQLLSIRQEVPGIVAGLIATQERWAPRPDAWSILECFEHLNATAQSFVPAIDRALDDARQRGLVGQGPFVYSWFERVFLQLTEPPARPKMWAPRALRPRTDRQLAEAVRAFMAWQDQLGERIRAADGFDLARARGRSPDFPWFSWSLGSLFAVTLAHERRHLRQARDVRRALSLASAS
jgi:hypothetical protein